MKLLLLIVGLGALKAHGFSVKPHIIKSHHPKVKMSVFYESLCPGCKGFITQQLGPNFDKFGKYLDVKLNSFGNAEMSFEPDTGLYRFKCQHGPPECLGSMLEACLINKMTTTPVPTINCIEKSSPRDPQTTKKCMDETGVESPSFEEVQNCAMGTEGNRLFAKLGKETASLNPPHEYVPWILFNDEHNEELEDKAIQNLPETLCKHFLSDVPECSPYVYDMVELIHLTPK